MAVENLEKILREHPFLHGMAQEHLQLLVGCASNRRFSEGEFLTREGARADILYLVRTGNVALEIRMPQGGGLRIETVHDGDILGWSCFLPPLRWRFDARALTPVRTLALDAECLRKKLEEDHEFGYQILRRLTLKIEARFQAARYQLLDVYGSSAEKSRERERR